MKESTRYNYIEVKKGGDTRLKIDKKRHTCDAIDDHFFKSTMNV